MSYKFPPDCKSLQATMGVYGVKTSRLETAHDVIDLCNKLFNLNFDFGFDDDEDHDILIRQQAALQSLSREECRLLIVGNVKKIPAELYSWKPSNQRRIAMTRRQLGMVGKW